MQNLKLLSNDFLLNQTRTLVSEERKLTTRILLHLREIEDRRLFAQRGYPSLFEMCVRELGYSEATAQRRISAMRLLRELPEIEKKLESGELKIGQVSLVQGFLRAEKREQGRAYSLQEKRELISRIEGKSTRETERALAVISPQSAGIKERERAVSATETEIRFIADERLLAKLKRLQELGAHRLAPGSRYSDLIDWLADLGLAKLEPANPSPARNQSLVSAIPSLAAVNPSSARSNPNSALDHHVKPTVSVNKNDREDLAPKRAIKAASHSRYIPIGVKRQVWVRDRGCCTFSDAQTGRRCDSRTLIQIDHIEPFALGGRSDDPANLRLLCFHHNQLEADRWFQAG